MSTTEKTFEILEQMSKMSGTGSRKDKLALFERHKDILHNYMHIALNPYRVFHINQIPDKSESLHKWCPLTLDELAHYLEQQKGGTKSNKDLVRLFLEQQTPLAAKWCEKAILKNVVIGVEAKSLNKIGYELPVFKCLLADPNKHNDLSGMKWPCIMQPKLDGCRAIWLMVDGKRVFMGRNGREVENLEIYNHIKVDPAYDNMVLDGEFFSYDRKFNSIVGYFTAHDRPLPEDIKFVVFNVMTIEEWEKQECKLNQEQQLDLIFEISQAQGSKNVSQVYYNHARDDADARRWYDQFLKDGYEGAMARNVDSTYKWCDTSDRCAVDEGIVVKLKPFEYADCIIKGSYAGNNANSNRLGGFLLDYNGVEVSCGGGFTHDMREHYWEIKNSLVGRWCRVKFTEKTEDGSQRFPIFDSLRDGK